MLTASVIIPCYNASGSLPETIESILPQLQAGDEVVIVDDGSTDETKAVVAPYLGEQVHYFYQTNSGGPASPRNRGVREARGEIVFIFDSDDLMLPGKVKSTREVFHENADLGMVFTNFRTIDEHGKVLRERYLDTYELPEILMRKNGHFPSVVEPPGACLYLARQNYVGTSGVAIRRKVFDEIGFFDESLRNGDDRDLWFRITRRYTVAYLPAEYHSYRIRAGSISKGSAKNRTGSKLKVLERQLEDPLNARFEKDLRGLIANNYMALAYEYFSEGEMPAAREMLRHARKHQFTASNLKLYAKTLVGRRLSAALRGFKKRWGSADSL